MVSPSRRAVFLLAMLLAIIAVGGSVLRPGSLSPIEQGLVGTWDVQRPSGQSKHGVLVFEADREMRSPDGKLLAQWRVSGSELVLEYTHRSYWNAIYSKLTGASRDDHELIIDPGGNRFTIKQLGGYEAVLTRSPAEWPSFASAIIAMTVVAGLLGMAAGL
jgi:hypothetical protein